MKAAYKFVHQAYSVCFFLYNPRSPAQPRADTVLRGLDHHTLINSQENDLPTDQSDEGSFLVEALSSQITLDCVKLTEKKNRTVFSLTHQIIMLLHEFPSF